MLVAIIGLGAFGEKTANSLFEKGAEVVAIDNNPVLIDKVKDRVTQAVCLDVTDERSLRTIPVSYTHLTLPTIYSV